MFAKVRFTVYAVLVLAAVSAATASAQVGAPILVMADGPNGAEKAGTETAAIDGTEWSEAPLVQNGLTIHVLFKDPANTGFRDATLGTARRARLYDAFRYIAETLNADGELNVMAGVSESDGTGPLAQGGSMFTAVDGFTNGTAFQRISTGTVPFANYAEMSLTFDWGYTWHAGSDAPPSSAIDLRSVALHEITHCLGFMSLMSANGTSRFSSIGKNTYTEFDRLMAKKSPFKRLLGGSSTAPVFAGTAADLTGGAVVFDGVTAVAVFGTAPPIYSSSPFQQGISLQHWAEDALPDGAVMEPRYAPGAMRREYTDVDIAVLRDIGWTSVESPDHEPCPIQSVTILQPTQSTIVADASNLALVQFRASVALYTPEPLCDMGDGVLRVAYFVDGVSRGVSGDEAGHFPLDLTLDAGTHRVRASATRTDSSEDPVVAEKTFSIHAPCPVQSVTIIEPSQSTLAADASNTALVHFRASAALDLSDPLCGVGSGVLRVAYFVDGVSRGMSGDEGNHFPLDLTLPPGTHTVRASATRTDSAAAPVEAQKTFSITATTVPQPKITVTPAQTARDFGSVNSGASADAVYTVKNTGNGTLTGAASLGGDAAFQFAGASTYSLSAGAESTVTVRFAPDKEADFAGTLSFGGNGGSLAVTLTGAGVKADGVFNCAGGEEAPRASAADLLVVLLAVSALFLARLLAAKQ